MLIALRVLLVLGGGVLLSLGIGFLTDPVGSSADFGITVASAHGITSVRADFTAFFMVAGASLVWGALARHRAALVTGGALMLIPLAVRAISLFTNGSFDGYIQPMVFEGVFGILSLIGAAVLPASSKRTNSIENSL
ncbi:MAG: hypothetical protein AAGL10_08155 [Pseudomonadota bacterium]